MTRVRLSVDLEPEMKRRVRMAAAAQEITVRQWIEQAIAESLQRIEDRDWMESDISRLGEFEPYEWGEGELDEGDPVRYVPGKGYVVVTGSDEESSETSG